MEMSEALKSVAPRRGRPRKFAGPSRAVTLTLPEEIIDTLTAVDRDLSRAVVRLAQPELRKRPHPPAELVTFGRRGVILVNPSRSLEERTGVMLVPLSDGRALICFDESTTAARLELAIQDALADRRLSGEDARIFEGIGSLLRDARRSPETRLQQRNIIVIESNRPQGRSSARQASGRRR